MDADSRSPRDGKHLEVLGYTILSCGRVAEESRIGFISRQNEENQEKIKLNKQLPYLVGNIIEEKVADITKKEVYLPFGAFVVIVVSQLQLNILCVLEHLIVGLTTFLWKLVYSQIYAIQALIMAPLETLNALIAANGDKLRSAAYGAIIEELSTVIRFFVVLIPFAYTNFDDLQEIFIHSKTASSHVDNRYHYIVRLGKNSIRISIQNLGKINPDFKYLEVKELCASTTTGDESENSNQEDDDREDDDSQGGRK
ncbi:Cullin-associated NEDD8-dissociated protein 1 [Orobanche minor]